MFVATQVAVIYGVDAPPGVIVIDDMFGISVVNVTLAEAVSPLEDVTVTVAVYEVPFTKFVTARDVAVVPVYELGSPLILYDAWLVDDQLIVAPVKPILDAVTLDTVGVTVARVVNVTLADAVSPLEDVTVTVAVYEVFCVRPDTARDVAVVPVYELGSPLILYDAWLVDDQLKVAPVFVMLDAVRLDIVGITWIGGV